MTPTLGMVPIFGTVHSCLSSQSDRAGRTYATFGSDGLEPSHAGGRGGLTALVGTLAGPGTLGLALAESAVRSFNDGRPRTFTDTTGHAWPQVLLEEFEPRGRVTADADGVCRRRYRITLRHLV